MHVCACVLINICVPRSLCPCGMRIDLPAEEVRGKVPNLEIAFFIVPPRPNVPLQEPEPDELRRNAKVLLVPLANINRSVNTYSMVRLISFLSVKGDDR